MQLAGRFDRDRLVLLLPDSWWSGQHEPEFESSKEFGKDFHKMQMGRGGECLACKGGSRTMNQNPQQPLIGMIFTNADQRYAGRFDDKQGGDTIVTM